jgi:predicted transcriptional regulator
MKKKQRQVKQPDHLSVIFVTLKKNKRKSYSRVKTVWKKLLKKDFIKMSNVRDYFILFYFYFLEFFGF